MQIHFEHQADMYDDCIRTNRAPIRTELLGAVLNELCDRINGLHTVLNIDGYFNLSKATTNISEINQLIDMLNPSEKGFVAWFTRQYTMADKNGNYASSNRTYHTGALDIGSINDIFGSRDFALIKGSVDRLHKTLSVSIFVNMHEHYQHENSAEYPFVSEDEIYQSVYNSYIEFCVEEFVATINISINQANRGSLSNRTCDKCGTVFQKNKSRNMHYSKCNGINRGYVVPKPYVPQAEKTSDW
jgi:hypothetical protein